MKYIDANKLSEKLKHYWDIQPDTDGLPAKYCYEARGVKRAIEYALSLIKDFQQEQPAVDLEKALDKYYKNADFGPSEAIEYEIHKDIARHFYELGLNSKK